MFQIFDFGQIERRRMEDKIPYMYLQWVLQTSARSSDDLVDCRVWKKKSKYDHIHLTLGTPRKHVF
jgi:hypothetical protein